MRDPMHHHFEVALSWHGNDPQGSESHAEVVRLRPSFSRAHTVSAPPAPDLPGSAAKAFRGDRDRWNPEQLFLAAIAQCHMLSFLFVAERAGVEVVSYSDTAKGVIRMDTDGIGGEFSTITLFPAIGIRNSNDVHRIDAMHDDAQRICFIGRSTRAIIEIQPRVFVA